MNKNETKMLMIGIAGGVVVGATAGYCVGRTTMKRRAREEIRKVRTSSYSAGYHVGIKENEERILNLETALNELKSSIIYVDSADPEDVKKAIDEHMGSSNKGTTPNTSDKVEAVKGALEGQIEASEGQEKSSDENGEEKDDEDDSDDQYIPDEMNFIGVSRENDRFIFEAAAGMKLYYPASIFVNPDNSMRSVVEIREKLKNAEPNVQKLNVVWSRLGWGVYIPDSDGYPTADDIDNWDLEIQDSTEPEEKTMERERYLDEIDRYQAHPEEGPRFVSRQEFEDENYLTKLYINWYEKDNVFIDSMDMDNEINSFDLLGVTNGKDLFNKNMDLDEDSFDPDVVYVKNFHYNVIAEVTRFHMAYQEIRDGSAYLNGSTN